MKKIIYPIVGNPKDISLRPVEKKNFKAHLSWMNDCETQATFVSRRKKFTVVGREQEFLKMYQSKKPKVIVYSIFNNNKLIGRLKFQKINWQTKKAASSTLLSTNPNIRGKGFGTKTAFLKLKLAKKLGIKKLTALIHSDNLPNIKIHEKLGYILTKRTPNKVLEEIDNLQYEKFLP